MNITSLEAYTFYPRSSHFDYKVQMKQISIETMKISRMISNHISLENVDQKGWFKRTMEWLKKVIEKIITAVVNFWNKLIGKDKMIERKAKQNAKDFDQLRQIAPTLKVTIPACCLDDKLPDKVIEYNKSIMRYATKHDLNIYHMMDVIGDSKSYDYIKSRKFSLGDDEFLKTIQDTINREGILDAMSKAIDNYKENFAKELDELEKIKPVIDLNDTAETTIGERYNHNFHTIVGSEKSIVIQDRDFILRTLKNVKEHMNDITPPNNISSYPEIKTFLDLYARFYSVLAEILQKYINKLMEFHATLVSLAERMEVIKESAVKQHNSSIK